MNGGVISGLMCENGVNCHHSPMQSNIWSGVLAGVQQSTFPKFDWIVNGLHSKIVLGFGLRIALQNIGVAEYPAEGST